MDQLTVAGTLPNFFNLPVWVAQDCGLFARQGIEVDLYLNTAIEEVFERVRDGRAQIGRNSTELVILDRERGGGQMIIAGNLNRLPFSFIVRPEIRAFADLRGKTIGVSSLAAGSSSLVMDTLAAHGLHHPADYRLLAMGPMVTRWDMLRSGEIDAGLQGVPYNFLALDGGFRELPLGHTGVTPFAFACFSADAGWAGRNRDLVERFLVAIVEAHRAIASDDAAPTDIAHAHMRDYGFGRDHAARSRRLCVADAVFPRDGDVSSEGLSTLIGLSSAIRDLPTRAFTRPDDYVDRSYLQAAWQRLGPEVV